MRLFAAARLALMALVCACLGPAQTLPLTPIKLSFTGSGASNSQTGLQLKGSGNLDPFGAATVSIGAISMEKEIDVSFLLTVGNSGSITATLTDPVQVDNVITGTATVRSGTGAFSGANGAFTFSIASPPGTPAGAIAFTLIGSGTLGTIPGFDATKDGSVYVFNNAAVVGFDGSRGGGLVFDGSSGTGASALREDGTGTSGSSVLVFDDNLGAQHSASLHIALPSQIAAAGYTAFARCPNTTKLTCWLTIPIPTGTVPAQASGVLTATVDPSGLGQGVYYANVTIRLTTGRSWNVPVKMLITASGPMLALSQTGLQFQAISGAIGSALQSISVSNARTGPLSFQTAASTLSGGNWLSASQATPALINVQANAQALAPGMYFGRVDFSAPGGVNSPQSVEVALTVVPATLTAVPQISATGLIFVAQPGVAQPGTSPAPQTVHVSNLSGQPLTVTATSVFKQGQGWFAVTSAQALDETVTVNPAGLAPGVYQGVLKLKVAETSATYPVAIVLVVRPSSVCTPTRLLPVLTRTADNFQSTAGLPLALRAMVVDDCGTPLAAGSVVATFSTDDPSVSMTALGNGEWAGTWLPHSVEGGPASIAVNATSFTPALRGANSISGALSANLNLPIINLGGVASAASFAYTPIAPGSFLSIFGSGLATQLAASESLPLQSTLAGTQVMVGGKALPLQFVSAGQINVIASYNTPANTLQQLLVAQSGAYSLPETLIAAQAQPAVFTQDQSGNGAGVIVVVKPDGTQFEATASNPAAAGDALVIYCAGLGSVDEGVSDGSASPGSPPANTVNSVTATIGNLPAQVLFAGLVPGFAGLYQVNVIVPSGNDSSPNVSVLLNVGGVFSRAVTVGIR